jgi:hypothetical protein
MLAHGSTAQFSMGLVGSISAWLGRHQGAGFLAGALLLAIGIAGPEMVDYISKAPWAIKLRLPKTPGERFRILETHVGEHLGTSETFPKLLERQSVLKRQVAAIDEKLAKTCGRIDGIDTELLTIKKMRAEAHTFLRFLYDVDGLMREIEGCIDRYRSMLLRYGENSQVIQRTFSFWRPVLTEDVYAAHIPPDVRDGELFARALESHIYKAQLFLQGWYGEFINNTDLVLLVERWRKQEAPVTSTEVTKLLTDHREALKLKRQIYAASFARSESAKEAMS